MVSEHSLPNFAKSAERIDGAMKGFGAMIVEVAVQPGVSMPDQTALQQFLIKSAYTNVDFAEREELQCR